MLYDYILKAKVRSIFIIYQEKKDNKLDSCSAVSYTHQTLPTNREV